MHYSALLSLICVISPVIAADWGSPPTVASTATIDLPMPDGHMLAARWVRCFGGDQPVAITVASGSESPTQWISITAFCANADDESITLRAFTRDGAALISRPLPLPPSGWLVETVRLERAPTVPAEPVGISRIELWDTNRKPHHLVIASLTPGGHDAFESSALPYPDAILAGLQTADDLTAHQRLGLARWAWISGDVGLADSAYSEILRVGDDTALSAAAELERALLPGIERSAAERSTALHAASARTVADSTAGRAALLLATHLREQGELDRALRALEPLAAADCPEGLGAPAWEESARVLLSMGDPTRCWEALIRAQTEATLPGELDALRRRVRTWLAESFSTHSFDTGTPLGRERALWELANGAGVDPAATADDTSFFAPLALLNAGERSRAAGDTAEALRIHGGLEERGASDPDIAARAGLYAIYCQGAESGAAVPALERLIMRFPAEARIIGAAYLNLGERLARQGDLAAASRALHRVSDARPGVLAFDLQAARRLAECYDRNGDPDASAMQWREALTIAQSRGGVAEFDDVARLAREALGLETAALTLTSTDASHN